MLANESVRFSKSRMCFASSILVLRDQFRRSLGFLLLKYLRDASVWLRAYIVGRCYFNTSISEESSSISSIVSKNLTLKPRVKQNRVSQSEVQDAYTTTLESSYLIQLQRSVCRRDELKLSWCNRTILNGCRMTSCDVAVGRIVSIQPRQYLATLAAAQT